jgi:arginine/lysine/ornithine decarboxylase
LVSKAAEIKVKISSLGFEVLDGEPLKIVIKEGERLADHLRENGIEVEFSDLDYTVLMLTPENIDADFDRLTSALSSYKKGERQRGNHSVKPHERVISIRSAMLSSSVIIPVEQAEGRICASPTVSCPPAVPIVISGERITKEDIELFKYYGVNNVSVI